MAGNWDNPNKDDPGFNEGFVVPENGLGLNYGPNDAEYKNAYNGFREDMVGQRAWHDSGMSPGADRNYGKADISSIVTVSFYFLRATKNDVVPGENTPGKTFDVVEEYWNNWFVPKIEKSIEDFISSSITQEADGSYKSEDKQLVDSLRAVVESYKQPSAGPKDLKSNPRKLKAWNQIASLYREYATKYTEFKKTLEAGPSNKFAEFFIGEELKGDNSGGDGTLDGALKLDAAQRQRLNLNAPPNPDGDGPQQGTEDLTPEQLSGIRQCALISDLLHRDGAGTSFSNQYMNNWDSGSAEPFNGRIYPVTTQDYDPNLLVNMCTTSKETAKYLENDNALAPEMFYKLFWVYNDNDSNKTLRESEIFLSTTQDDYDLYEQVAGGTVTQDRAKQVRDAMRNGYGYSISKVNVEFKGTNPSTARNDVTVSIQINLDNLKSVDATCSFIRLSGKEKIELKIYDLVTLPTVQTVETMTNGNGSYNKNQYSPDYSRIRLKVWSNEGKDIDSIETALIVDLATIDHELKRKDDGAGSTTLTITYKGYFEQSLNDPFNDALAGGEITDKRYKRRLETNKILQQRNCSALLIKKTLQVQQERDRLEALNNIKEGDIIKRMFAKSKMFGYAYDTKEVERYTVGGVLNPRQNFIKDQKNLGEINLENVKSDDGGTFGWITKYFSGEPDNSINESQGVNLGNQASKGFEFYGFYLGDLMNEVLDCLYEENSDKLRQHSRNLNMKFIVGTLNVPDPVYPDRRITINPLAIPIDYNYFRSWYHDSIVKKGIVNYPVGVFIKDLIERLVNDIIYDGCFSNLLPGETPPSLRTTFFSDHDKNWFQYSKINGRERSFSPNTPYGSGKKNKLMKSKINVSIDQVKNYCVIYQQNPSYKRQLEAERKSKLSDDPYTMKFYYGANKKSTNYITNVSFRKTDSPFLREARYFNSNFGNLSLLSNVYDLNFTIESPKAITEIYPGNLIEFILTDWAPSTEYEVGDPLLDSDPHIENSRAHIIGLGGYYIVKSVKYSLNLNVWNDFKVQVETKFLGTDAPNSIRTNSKVKKVSDDSKACVDIYNDKVEKLSTEAEDYDIEALKFDKIYSNENTNANAGGSPNNSSGGSGAPGGPTNEGVGGGSGSPEGTGGGGGSGTESSGGGIEGNIS